MTIPRATTQDINPAQEAGAPGAPTPKTPATPHADGTPESLHTVDKSPTRREEQGEHTPSNHGDEHIGATEEQVSDTTAPAGSAFKDEPKQG